MELGDIVGKYGTQLKEKITDIYDNNKRKIQATILGSSLLCTSGCLDKGIITNENRGYIINKHLVTDYKDIDRLKLHKLKHYEEDYDGDGIRDKISLGSKVQGGGKFAFYSNVYIKYGKTNRNFEKKLLLGRLYWTNLKAKDGQLRYVFEKRI